MAQPAVQGTQGARVTPLAWGLRWGEGVFPFLLLEQRCLAWGIPFYGTVSQLYLRAERRARGEGMGAGNGVLAPPWHG